MSTKSVFVSAAGFQASFWTALDRAARKRGLDDEAIYAALKEESPLIDQFADLMATETSLSMGEALAIQIPALTQPTLTELREKFSWIREENGIEGDDSPTDAVTLKLGTVLRQNENSINGAEYERRRKSIVGMLGYQHAVWLVEHQDEFPEFMALLGKIYIDFPGLVVVLAVGRRGFPFLYRDGLRWGLGWFWAEGDLRSDGQIAVSSK